MSTNRNSLLPFRVVAILVVLAMFLAPISSSFALPAPEASLAPEAPSAASGWGIGTLTDQNLWDLIAQMTVAEEDTFIHGSTDNACSTTNISPWVQGCMGQAGWIPGIPTLGIPPLRLDDGPAGSRLGHVATAMPAPIGLTASFSRTLAFLFGAKVGIEQRALNQDVWLAPMMNTVNIPTGGRNFETTGEDPYLSGEMATQLMTGSQSSGLMATVKHYVDNDFENGRNSTTVLIDERTQHEVELQAFEKALKAGAAAIMCSYNRVDDVYACGNDQLLNQLARGLFGFKGFVMSDWGATHTPQDLIHGLDMEQSGSGNLGNPVIHAILLTTTVATANTSLFADSVISDTNIKVASVTGFTPTQTILIDIGANLETRTVAGVGTAGTSTTLSGGSTTLSAASLVGDTNIKVGTVSNFTPTQTIWIDTGANLESATITAVGTTGATGTGITLAAPLSLAHASGVAVIVTAPAGATNIKVASVTNLTVTDILLIDTGANLETVAITSVGTSGANGTGVDITPALSLAHASGTAVKDQSKPGTGITLTVELVNAHAIGAAVVAVLPAGSTNVKIASNSDFRVGHVIAIDTGANQESATVTAVGSGGVTGGGLTITPALTLAHVNGALVSTSGTPPVPATNDMPAQPAYTSAEWKAALDQSVFRILTEMNNAGLLEGTQYGSHSNGCNRSLGSNCTSYIPARADLQVIQPDMFAAAQQIAEASAVLLKNDNNVLPLTCADLTTGNGVVLMGPTAISTYTGGGGSAHVIPFDPVQSSYDALIAAATAKCGSGVKITYVPGYDIDGPIAPSSVLSAPDTSNPYPYWTLTPADVAFSNQPGLLRQQVITSTVAISGVQPTLVYTDGLTDQLDPIINYTATNTLPAGTAWRWTGLLTAPASPVSGTYQLRIFIKNQANASLYTEGLTTAQRRINLNAFPNYFPNSMTSSYASLTVANKSHDPNFQYAQVSNYSVVLTATQQVHLDLRVTAGITTPTQVQFRWVPPTNQADQTAIAVAAASAANKAIDFVWDEGSEGSDRGGNAIANGLATPGYQDAMVSAVVAANPNTAVVLNTGDSVFMPWASTIQSILEMWYPGQMGGAATANVLLGNVNPGGKLPETFYDGSAPIGQRFPQDTQPAACANGTANYGTASSGPGATGSVTKTANYGVCPLYPGIYQQGFLWDANPLSGTLHSYRTINYSDQSLGGIQGSGIFQGYRWFDKNGYTPLFPFGHGLSYTQFEYTNLKVTPVSDGLSVNFNLKNIGSVVGDEVPQVYIGAPITAPVPMPVKLLAAFDRITLNPGETKSVTLHVGVRELSYWSVVTHDWALALTGRPLYVGSSSRDIRLQTTNATLPTVAITPDRAPNANGWYTSTVTFTAVATTTAGIGYTCDAPRAYSSPDSITASVTMTCTDTANNVGTATANFKYDATAPTVAPSVSPNPVLFNNPATANANALDSTSGISATTCSAASTTTVGTKVVTCTATDNAGNRSAVGVAAYSVVYPYTGVSPDVNHTGTGPTGYQVTFRLYDPTATKVYLRGEWFFSTVASTTITTSQGLLPSQWVPGAFPIAYPNSGAAANWPIVTMTLDSATGVWSYTTPLPPGVYTYNFYRNCPNAYPSLSGCTAVYDPGNMPWNWNTSGSVEASSQVYVPADPAFGGVDYSWQAPNPIHGTLYNVTYPSPQSTNPVGSHYMAVYLPYGYNPSRTVPYPTLYLSHGGGGNEIDWSTQGVADEIIDNLIATGHAQPMVVVMTNFNGLPGGTAGYRTDVISNVIPYMESHYNVSHNANDRAFAGLSMGAQRANDILFNATTTFGYVGSWSIGAGGSPAITSTLWTNPDLKTRLGIQIGGGRFDSITVPGINNYEATFITYTIPFVDDRVDGGHEWYVWRILLNDYASTMAFKHTTTSIVADSAQNVIGSSVTFTATVTKDTTEPAAPTGSVKFYLDAPLDADHLLGSANVDGNGHATLSSTSISSGTHTVTGVYGGDNFYNPSASAALTHTVGALNAPVVTVMPDRAPNANGWYTSTVTFTATATSPLGLSVTCDAPKTYSGPDSATASVTMMCTDTASNTGSAAANFKFDKTAPTLAPSVSPNPVLFNNPATASANAADVTAGINVSATTCSAASTITVGSKTVSCTATDNAGNKTLGVAAYSVVYPFTGVSPEVVHTGTGPTGYAVTFRIYDPTATKMYIKGEWYFSTAANTTMTTSEGLLPSQWVPGAFPIAYPNATAANWPVMTMTLDAATGIWSYNTPLPSGYFTYQYFRNCPNAYPSLTGCTAVYDPANLPWNTNGTVEPTSQVYVPSDPAFGTVDYSSQAPNAVHGTLYDVTYPSPQSTSPVGSHYMAVYLPYGYNPNRSVPYPTLYLSHGGGGNEVDWSTQGVAGNIIDNLIATGQAQPMVVIMTNFNGLSGGTPGYRTDVISNVIPYVESHYNVSHNSNDRAFAGLSAGGQRGNDILFNAPTTFGYYSIQSTGGGVPAITSTLWTNPDLKTRLGIQIGGGLQDPIRNRADATLDEMARMAAYGIPFVEDSFNGGHEWYVWRIMLYDFVKTMAFKHTTTSITADSNQTRVGSSVTFAATVTEDTNEPGSPSGTVEFYRGAPLDAGHLLGSAIVDSSGHATLSVSNLSTGVYTVTAVYGGDNFYNGSTSAALLHLVGGSQVFLPIVTR